jgi:threonine dehydratase
MKNSTSFLSAADLLAAHERVKPHIVQTPVLSSRSINALANAQVFFKCENFQKIGAFKARGATNAVFSVDEMLVKNGVVTHSSGNHAQAVAYAAALKGLTAYVVMPHNTNPSKIAGVKACRGQIIFCEPTLKSREETAQKVIEETGAHFIHPYNDWRVVAGQSTAAIELLQEKPDLDLLLAPVGGGGLISGTALAAHYFSPQTQVLGAEPLGANDAAQSLDKGVLLPQTNPQTIADGLRGALGDITFSVIQSHVKQIVTVTEPDIAAAMFLIWERLKIMVEPSCAVPLAAVLLRKSDNAPQQRIGIILSGGNIDFSQVAAYQALAEQSETWKATH